MIIQIQELYFSKTSNYLNNLPCLRDDVMSYSKNFAYPLTTILINEYLNGNSFEKIDGIIKEVKVKKLYDVKNSSTKEILEKIENQLGCCPKGTA